MQTFTFNGDGVKTCKCCEKKMSSKGGLYEGVCSSTCSSKQLEYNSIPINLLFIKRLYIHINDEKTREEQIDKFITINKLNKDMTKHKIKRIAEYFLSNQLDKLEIKRNSIYHINLQK
ncbi:hypothetical protein CKA55_07220 [Arcobacter suis]|uniref:Uncharacterized protein n=1 Tax=Arcobacter suis CECT 7833 TaxID=663365 RepID=A0AAD0SPH8_9BACT|nr:hypothetical protein [Arcobacter suis]AXX89288.1 hypothetical protein ASUIS_0795 [Arcobacter suis CECT 7833]RWS46521.1 hypothetical protein CKA55_07220 [Arcobacter suis]